MYSKVRYFFVLLSNDDNFQHTTILMRKFFEDVVFSPDETLELDQRYLELFSYLGIELSPIQHSCIQQEIAQPQIPTMVHKEKHQCTVCHKSFNLRKLLVRNFIPTI